ncbi:hypothetical protein HOK00_04295, partial [bacterium]|nr:hypothetical protein [bacterium]
MNLINKKNITLILIIIIILNSCIAPESKQPNPTGTPTPDKTPSITEFPLTEAPTPSKTPTPTITPDKTQTIIPDATVTPETTIPAPEINYEQWLVDNNFADNSFEEYSINQKTIYHNMESNQLESLKYLYNNFDNNVLDNEDQGIDIFSYKLTPESLHNLQIYLDEYIDLEYQLIFLKLPNSPLAIAKSESIIWSTSDESSDYWTAFLWRIAQDNAKTKVINIFNNPDPNNYVYTDEENYYTNTEEDFIKKSPHQLISDKVNELKESRNDNNDFIINDLKLIDTKNKITNNLQSNVLNLFILGHMNLETSDLVINEEEFKTNEIFDTDFLISLNLNHINIILSTCTRDFVKEMIRQFEEVPDLTYFILYNDPSELIKDSGRNFYPGTRLNDLGDILEIAYFRYIINNKVPSVTLNNLLDILTIEPIIKKIEDINTEKIENGEKPINAYYDTENHMYIEPNKNDEDTTKNYIDTSYSLYYQNQDFDFLQFILQTNVDYEKHIIFEPIVDSNIDYKKQINLDKNNFPFLGLSLESM